MRKKHILAILLVTVSVFLVACNKADTIICGSCFTANSTENQYCSNCGTAFSPKDTIPTTEIIHIDTSPQDSETSTDNSTQNPDPSTQPTQQKPSTNTHTHSYSAATCTSPKKCSCGATSGNALGHNWESATCASPKKCSRCGTTSGKASAHNYSTKVTAPTCTTKGYTIYTCSSCGDSYKDNYTKASHNYKKYKCTSCGIVDKSHAYEYLIEWVKTNGVKDDNGVAIIEYVDDYMHTISYDSSEKYLYVSTLDTNDGSFAYVDLSSKSQNYFYMVNYGKPIVSSVSGKIKASTYTGNTLLPYEEYHGRSDKTWKTWFLDYTQAYMNLNIAFLSSFIKQCIPEISITDLGFTSY